MKVLRTRGIQFVFHQVTKDRCFVCRPGVKSAELYETVNSLMLTDPSTVFIVDTGAEAFKAKCLDNNAFTVVIASPHAAGVSVIQEFVNKPVFAKPKLYMPGWREDELQVCRQVVAPTDAEEAAHPLKGLRLPAVSAATVKSRFQRFGGVIRAALSPSSDALLEAELNKALLVSKLDVISPQLGGTLDLLPAASSWILHYVVDERNFASTTSCSPAPRSVLTRMQLQSGRRETPR